MSEHEIMTKARDLMDAYALDDWKLGVGRGKRQLGLTRYARKTIELSRPLMEINGWDVFENVVRHEIAHAIAGFEAGHGPVWRQIAREVGADPRATMSNINAPEPRYRSICPNCGKSGGSLHRKSKRMWNVACRTCCQRHNRGKFDRRFLFEWVDTETGSMIVS